MGMYWKAVVDMFGDAVMLRTCFIQRVDMYNGLTEIAHVVEELMADLCGERGGGDGRVDDTMQMAMACVFVCMGRAVTVVMCHNRSP
jgi:hypothetical protein